VSAQVAVAVPLLTVAGDPQFTPDRVNWTVPPLTVPPADVTFAVTVTLLEPYVAEAVGTAVEVLTVIVSVVEFELGAYEPFPAKLPSTGYVPGAKPDKLTLLSVATPVALVVGQAGIAPTPHSVTPLMAKLIVAPATGLPLLVSVAERLIVPP
jgi:hypothetical protein